MSDTEQIDKSRRKFLLNSTYVIGGIGAAAASVPFVASWWPSEKAQAAGAPVEADISKMADGQLMIIKWRGKPVWVVNRTDKMLETLKAGDPNLRDPDSLACQQPDFACNYHRSLKPKLLVLIGICTHLGCSPKYKPTPGDLSANWKGGFYCPCHGSTFDLSGRVYKGVPAPINLEVPPYVITKDNILIVGTLSV